MRPRRPAVFLILVCAAGLLGLPSAGAEASRELSQATPRSITSDLDLREDFDAFHGRAGANVRAWLGAARETSSADVDRKRERRTTARSTGRALARMERAENRFRRLYAGASGLSSAARSCRVLTLADDYATLRRRIQKATRSLLLSGRLRQRLDLAISVGDTARAAELRTALDVVERTWRIRRTRVARLHRATSAGHRILSDCLSEAAGVCAGVFVPLGRNVLANPGAEAQAGGDTSTSAPQPQQWRVPSGREPGVIMYGANGYPTAPSGGGSNFFSGAANPSSRMSQRLNLCRLADLIDDGAVVADLSALLGGFSNQSDNAGVVLSFIDDSGARIGGAGIGPVTPDDRDDRTILLPRSRRITVPAGTRAAIVQVIFERTSGISNDGYADNISVVLRNAG